MHAMFTLEAGIVVTSEPGNARIVLSSYDKIEELRQVQIEVLVILDFFRLPQGKIKSVPSHVEALILQGSIIAGVKADLYENFTGSRAAHPGNIHQPHSIPQVNLP